MSNVSFRDRTNLCSQQSRNGDGFSRERHEFDFVSRTVLVNVDDGANVARLQSFVRNVFHQHDAIVFANQLRIPPIPETSCTDSSILWTNL